MTPEEMKAMLEAIGKGGIKVAGDLVLEKHVEHEVANVETGGIGIQINNTMTPITNEEIDAIVDGNCSGGTQSGTQSGTQDVLQGVPQDNSSKDTRQAILDELMALAEKGDWVEGITTDDAKGMLTTVLGRGETPLSDEETEMSEELWGMLEHGRGDRVKIVCANLVGYFAEKKLFVNNDTPALSVQFFGNKKSIDNINKGKNGRLSKVTPLLDAYAPKMVKKR